MDRPSSSRKRPIVHEAIVIDHIDLAIVQSNAKELLLANAGFDVAEAWVRATLDYLASKGHLKSTDSP